MAALTLAYAPDVTTLANRILSAWTEGRDAVLRDELNTATYHGLDADHLDFVEQERMEVLQSVVETIQQKRYLSGAGLRLLKHLAAPAHN